MKRDPIERGCSIKETAELYSISIDTLYYYERIGLVVPPRNERNGYRIYQADDFYRLNIITELRSMGFDFEQIQSYFDQHTFASTMTLMNAELSNIDDQMKHLSALKGSIVDSLQRYTRAIAAAQDEDVVVMHIPERPCLLVSDEEIYHPCLPYAYARRARERNMRLSAFHSTPCYRIDVQRKNEDGFFLPNAILLLAENLPGPADCSLPGGLYASCTFKGTFIRSPEVLESMTAFVADQGYRTAGDPIEFCLIGEYESDDRAEHISRLEIPVEPQSR